MEAQAPNGSMSARVVPITPLITQHQRHHSLDGEVADEKWKGKARDYGDGAAGGGAGLKTDTMLWALSAVAGELARKMAVAGQYWNINFALLAIQSAVAVGGIVLWRWKGGLRELKGLERRIAVKSIPLAILNLASGYLALKALQCVALPTFVLLTNTILLLTSYFSTSGPAPTARSEKVVQATVLIAMSVWVNVLVDGNYAESMAGDRRMEQTLEPQDPTIWLMVGYAYVAGHVLLKTAEGVLRERWGKRDRWELGAWDVLLYNSILTLPISFILSFFIENFGEENMNDNFPASTRTLTISCILLSALCVLSVTLFGERCRKKGTEAWYQVTEQGTRGLVAASGILVYGGATGLGTWLAVCLGTAGSVLERWGGLAEWERKEVKAAVKMGRGRKERELPV